ncbi:MAG: hypothetical protein HYZ09_03745 [Candidatus Kerfeldbacteria bacterium]|nr:hypothetical protein [Candidatus Kerfeldbacteria bacterium]
MSRRRPRGILLIELIIAMGVASLIGGIILGLNIDQLRLYRFAQERSEIENSTRLAIGRVIRIIRDAAPSNTGAFPILTADAQTLTLFANIDADADVERVRFFLNGTLLQRGVIQPVGDPAVYLTANEVVSTVTTNVRNGAAPVFEYFEETYLGSGSPLTQPVDENDVRLVRMTLTVDVDPASEPVASTLSTLTQLRNLKENY